MAFLAPIIADLIPRVRVPSVVLEIIAGVIVGPSGFGWIRMDTPINVLSLFGLAMLLFLAGLEVEIERFRGRLLWVVLRAFGISLALALVVGLLFFQLGLVRSPIFIAIVLAATALEVVTPSLKDAGQSTSLFGQ